MSPIEIYAITFASVFAAFFCFQRVRNLRYHLRIAKAWLTKYLIFTNAFPRTRWFGPCTLSTLLAQAIVLAANLFLIFYDMDGIQSAAQKAGQIAVVNTSVFYLGPHLSYQADSLNISLSSMKSIHRGAIFPFVAMIAFHAAVLRPSQPIFALPISEQFYGIIVRRFTSYGA